MQLLQYLKCLSCPIHKMCEPYETIYRVYHGNQWAKISMLIVTLQITTDVFGISISLN